MDIKNIIQQFRISGNVSEFFPYGSGHINDTYKVEAANSSAKNYLLQRINHHVFKDVPGLMENILRVCTHLRYKLEQIPGADPERESLTLVEAIDGKPYFLDDTGNYFRMYVFIEDHKTYEIVKTERQALEAGLIFGKFQNLMSDLPGGPLNETIKDFHNIEVRLNGFFESVEKDKLLRLAKTGPEVRFVEERIDEMKILLELSKKGEIPTRVTHNDTKISNVLMDKNDNGLCVIDLDTVMPGLAHYDFGDAIRTATNTGAEDEADLDMVEMDIRLYEAYTRGYLKEMTSLNKTEIEYLPLAGKLFAYSQGMRFLKDYLDGDTYYKINHKEHNLQRTRAQFKLLVSMERQYDRMIEIVNNVSNEYSL
ncbi:MAG TPA: aminoglycoside phosphotransferase family protein [Bacteroides sp.]|nr:aminoglycoside phosphotransferase family protein [Bacteroides sp.]